MQAVEAAAQVVLDVRAQFSNASLADLYDPNTMPSVLVKAHQALDKAVDLCYRPQPFINGTKRIEFLFELYDKYTDGMVHNQNQNAKRKNQQDSAEGASCLIANKRVIYVASFGLPIRNEEGVTNEDKVTI